LVSWEGITGGIPTTWMLGLAVGCFSSDGRADVVFTGVDQLTSAPVLVTWHSLNVAAQDFQVSLEYLAFQPSDVVKLGSAAGCADIAISDVALGNTVEVWKNDCNGTASFSYDRTFALLSGTSPGRGTVIRAADVNSDGRRDIVCRQRAGSVSDSAQLELLIKGPQDRQYYLEVGAFDTTGLEEDGSNQLLRPRNLGVGDMFGSSRPEVAAAFVPRITAGTVQKLELCIWSNGCVGDVNGDGRVDVGDVGVLLNAMGSGTVVPEADLNRNGLVDVTDFAILLGNYGCSDE
jgi:hypothetical protein